MVVVVGIAEKETVVLEPDARVHMGWEESSAATV